MRFYAENLTLPEPVFLLLRDLIHEYAGMFYENDKRELLADKLSPLVFERGFDSMLDYYYLLKYDAEAAKEWKRVINALSVQETFFWREIDQMYTLVEQLVPNYASAHPLRTIKIWSAACATGEEPLTIAMVLNEKGWFDRAPIEIYGSDASSSAIKLARTGLYRERSFRNLSPELREKYFSKIDDKWRISAHLHNRINWLNANLMTPGEVDLLATSPFIFCRNVFIYFSRSAITKTVDLFARQMPSPGFLFVGASESLIRLTAEFELKEIGNTFVYVKN